MPAANLYKRYRRAALLVTLAFAAACTISKGNTESRIPSTTASRRMAEPELVGYPPLQVPAEVSRGETIRIQGSCRMSGVVCRKPDSCCT